MMVRLDTRRPLFLGWREATAWMAAVVVSRLLLLLVLDRVLGGREFADDAMMLLGMADAPLELLRGQTGRYGQHPPLLSLALAAATQPLRGMFTDFVALRAGLVLYEALLVGFTALALQDLLPNTTHRRWTLLAVVALPSGWMTSVVLAQDETFAAALAAATFWLAVRGRGWAALILAGVGVVAGKLFLGVSLMALVVVLPQGTLFSRACVGAAPVALVYGWVTLAAWLQGAPPPLVGFHPGAEFGINAWYWFAQSGVASVALRRWSGLLVLVVVGVQVVWILRTLRRADVAAHVDRAALLAMLTVALFVWVFSLFYHITCVYYLLPVPFLAAAVPMLWRKPWGPLDAVAVAVMVSVPHATHFLGGVVRVLASGASTGRAKGQIVEAYQTWVGIDPKWLHALALGLCVASSLWVAVRASNWLFRLGADSAVTAHGRRPASDS